MHKHLLFLAAIFFGSLVFISQPAHAQMGSMMGGTDNEVQLEEADHTESITEVLETILAEQNVSTIQEVDCGQISDEDLEHLGDAVMEQQHPGEAHVVMDEMMGGEGSESLRQMHINMGSTYLGCNNGNGNYGPGMMGGGMMGGMMQNQSSQGETAGFANAPMMGFGSMMGAGSFMGAYSIIGLITWIVLITFLLAGIYYFIKQAQK